MTRFFTQDKYLSYSYRPIGQKRHISTTQFWQSDIKMPEIHSSKKYRLNISAIELSYIWNLLHKNLQDSVVDKSGNGMVTDQFQDLILETSFMFAFCFAQKKLPNKWGKKEFNSWHGISTFFIVSIIWPWKLLLWVKSCTIS